MPAASCITTHQDLVSSPSFYSVRVLLQTIKALNELVPSFKHMRNVSHISAETFHLGTKADWIHVARSNNEVLATTA